MLINMKVLILIILSFLTIALIIVGKSFETKLGASVILDPITSEVNTIIKSEQDNEFSKTGKYKYVPPTTLPDGTTYKVDEYVTGDGQVGYNVYITKQDGSQKNFGVGVDSSTVNIDWQPAINLTITSTPEI
jgi:hypothetical protein